MTPDELELLNRHRPVLRFDPQYDYRLLAAESAIGNPGNLIRAGGRNVIATAGGEPPLSIETLSGYPGGLAAAARDCLALGENYPDDSRRMEWEDPYRGRIYGRVVADGGRTWLQYWFWLYYNPKHLFGFGKHEGDWEMVQVGLGEDGKPEAATYAQHNSGETRPWRPDALELWPDDPRRPVVYVAPLSHASYFEAGSHPYLPGIDNPFAGGPAAAELPVAEFGPWVQWPGRWGVTKRSLFGATGAGPRSPAHQGTKWESPDAWHRHMGWLRFRVRLGRALHSAGKLTFPRAPTITGARRDGEEVRVDWRLDGLGLRRGRHLYLTLHQDHFVLASEIVRRADDTGSTRLRVPPGRTPTAVMLSSYNRLRQRSDPVAVEVRA
jgi:hypothetical protein